MEDEILKISGTAKVQGYGRDKVGRERYMMYLNRDTINLLELEKGNTIAFTIWVVKRTKPTKKDTSHTKKNLRKYGEGE